MRTIATLNLPASTSGICRSAPPWAPVPAQSADAGEPPALADGAVEPEADASADVAAVGAVVAVPPLEHAPTMTATVIRTISHDGRRVIPGPPPPPARDRPPQDGTERVRAQDSGVAT